MDNFVYNFWTKIISRFFYPHNSHIIVNKYILNKGAIMSKDLAREMWGKVLENYRNSLETDEEINGFTTWLSLTRGYDFTPEAFTISVPSKFFGDFLSEHYKDSLLKHVQDILGTNAKIELKFFYEDSQKPLERIPFQPEVIESKPRETQNYTQENTNIKEYPTAIVQHNNYNSDLYSSKLNPRYTFKNFVIGSGNKFAYSAAIAVADKLGVQYNPLFIHGGVGLGKTHIMQAVGNHIIQKDPTKKVYYTSSEAFTNEMIQSIQTRTTFEFRQKYRTIDLLMIDDIQFLIGKEGTQEEFFHTFNSLYDAQKQIILTSDRPPKELKTLEARLISRFSWGMVTDISAPDFETRIAILQKKMTDDNITSIPHEVVNFIAKNVKSNIRELEGALVKVLADSSHANEEITVEFAKNALKSFIQYTEEISINSIMKAVSKYYGIAKDELSSKKRTNDVAFPRQVCMYLATELTNLSLSQIASNLGKKDHSTVIHARKKLEVMIKEDEKVKREIENIRNIL